MLFIGRRRCYPAVALASRPPNGRSRGESNDGLNYTNIYDDPQNHIVFLIIGYSGFRPAACLNLSLSPSPSWSNIRRSRRRQVLYDTLFSIIFPPFSVPFHLESQRACFLASFSVSFQCPRPGSKQQQPFGVSWRRKSRLFWDFRTEIASVYRLGGFF